MDEKLKKNLTASNAWVRLVYMLLFALLLEVAGVVMLVIVVLQFVFSLLTGGSNDNLRRFGDQLASFIYQALQFLIYNTEEKPFPFSEWPEAEKEDLSVYESAAVDVEAEAEIVVTEPDSGAPVEKAKAIRETVIELGADEQPETPKGEAERKGKPKDQSGKDQTGEQ